MDTDALLSTVSRLVWPDSPDLTCGETGHPAGHTCVPADDDVDLYDLADALDSRYGQPLAEAGVPPLPLDGQVLWIWAWAFGGRWIALGRARGGTDPPPRT